jgi:hypothetical protein
MKIIDDDLQYSKNNDYFNFDLSNIKKHNFLKPYTRLFEASNSINYSNDDFNIN